MRPEPSIPTAHEVLSTHETVLIIALRVYRHLMATAEKEAHDSLTVLTKDPHRQAVHDASNPLTTTEGYRLAVEDFKARAASATRAAADILQTRTPSPKLWQDTEVITKNSSRLSCTYAHELTAQRSARYHLLSL